MALTLSSAASSKLEPMRKNRWIMQFDSLPGSTGAESLAFAAKTASTPSATINPIENKRLNETFKMAGSPTWNDIQMTFTDYIQSNEVAEATVSAAQALWKWFLMIYNPITGAMGYKYQYATTGTLAHLGPNGLVQRVWNIFYCWPSDINWGDGLSADDDGMVEVSATFKYDYAVISNDANQEYGVSDT